MKNKYIKCPECKKYSVCRERERGLACREFKPIEKKEIKRGKENG